MAVERQRQAHVGVDRPLLGRVVVRPPAARDPRAGHGVVEDLVAPAESAAEPVRLVVPHLARAVGRERPLPALGDDVDDPADGVGAVQRGLGAADDLDPVDLIEAHVGEVEPSRRRAVDPHPVDQHLDLLGAGPPDADLGELADTARALDLEPGDLAKRVAHGGVVVELQVFFRNHGHRRPQALLGLLDLGRRHDDRVELARFLTGPRSGGRQRHQRSDESCPHDPSHALCPFPRKGSPPLLRAGLLTRGSWQPSPPSHPGPSRSATWRWTVAPRRRKRDGAPHLQWRDRAGLGLDRPYRLPGIPERF